MIFSFFLGAILAFTFAFQNKEEKLDSKSKGSFEYGDVRMTIIDMNQAEHPKYVDGLMISKDNYPFIFLFREPAGKINSFAISDGENKLAIGFFNKGRISEFGIYGNKIHDNQKMPVFTFDASDKPGVWHNVKYMPTVKAIMENGKVKSYAAVGEMYDDIDFDGRFDAKRVYNKESEIVFEYIYIDGEWLVLDNRGSDEGIKRIGHYSEDRLDAVTYDGEEKVYYDFEIGKGWKKRPDASLIDDVH